MTVMTTGSITTAVHRELPQFLPWPQHRPWRVYWMTLAFTSETRAQAFPAPLMTVFFALQTLDVLTTLIGLHLGAKEASLFVGRLLQLGFVSGLLISKCFAIIRSEERRVGKECRSRWS